MVSTAISFDRLAYVDRLKSGGIDETQARAHADALDAALRDTVATKSDLEALGRDLRQEIADLRSEMVGQGVELRGEIAALGVELRGEIAAQGMELRSEIADVRRDMSGLETRLDAKIDTSAANLKVEILRWLFVSQIALGGFLFASMKFVR
ncbi:DUF1640 domain-containing protein [Methylocystis parvus]|uniref:DUF1640 domain-containing protein n=1 Tax=Methylocystis parvus TaxID=134 RepID=A0A6B8MAB7_9HYPH|nr:DUF1640 domain-containing protein [Methylocystis parvus]QGM98692.1 DUF1640 domain-containing protein [Methylocystis parvus]WBK00959.1 DUF1640 domain-containing protein [Methylocystis parvus OBBP]